MILVTGGAGFIGSALIKALNDEGRQDIVVVDRFKSSEKWRNLRNVKFEEYIQADELFRPEFEDIFETIEVVFHMGACSSTTERNVDYLMENNVDFSKNLFEICTELDIPFIYASSAATYGNGELGYEDNQKTLPQLRPLNAYGYSKQLFDEWVLRRRRTPPKWYGLKFFNVFGPNEYHKGEMRSLVHKAFGQINDGGVVRLFKSHRDDYEDGKQLRDFIYVKDVVAAMVHLLKAKGKSGIYNMGTGQARSFYDLVEATFKAMGRETNIEYIDMPESIRDQYQYYTQADMSKMTKAFPQIKMRSLEEAVTDYVQNHLLKDDPYLR